MVVYGSDGLDEISISGETLVGELVNGEIREYELHPSQFGLEVYDRRAIQVNSVEESKQMILAVLENQPGPALNIVVLNAGAALYVAGVAKSIEDGIERRARRSPRARRGRSWTSSSPSRKSTRRPDGRRARHPRAHPRAQARGTRSGARGGAAGRDAARAPPPRRRRAISSARCARRSPPGAPR